jgi:hypothetical protein
MKGSPRGGVGGVFVLGSASCECAVAQLLGVRRLRRAGKQTLDGARVIDWRAPGRSRGGGGQLRR